MLRGNELKNIFEAPEDKDRNIDGVVIGFILRIALFYWK
jgi:hypothetical protein